MILHGKEQQEFGDFKFSPTATITGAPKEQLSKITTNWWKTSIARWEIRQKHQCPHWINYQGQRFSTLDLQSGYWQVTISPEDREKKKWIVVLIMPLGLSTAPVTFRWLMKGVSSLQLCFFFLIAPTSTIELHDNSQTEGHLVINKSFSPIF